MCQVTECYFEGGRLPTNLYLLDDLSNGHSMEGPAIIIDKNRLAEL